MRHGRELGRIATLVLVLAVLACAGDPEPPTPDAASQDGAAEADSNTIFESDFESGEEAEWQNEGEVRLDFESGDTEEWDDEDRPGDDEDPDDDDQGGGSAN